MTKSKQIKIVGNIGSPWFLNAKSGNWELVQPSTKITKRTEVRPARPFMYERTITDDNGNPEVVEEMAYELSVFTQDGSPSALVKVTLFQHARCWADGFEMDRETGEPTLHPELKQGDLISCTGAYRTRTHKDSKDVEHINHEIAINGAHQLRRLPSVKRMSYAEARKLLAAKTAKETT
jgi:hypothetical protein